jgi:hypothetical protein
VICSATDAATDEERHGWGFCERTVGAARNASDSHRGPVRGIDKIYIHTVRDLVVSPALQRTMIAATAVRREVTLDTGRAPFAAAPVELAKAIESAAR